MSNLRTCAAVAYIELQAVFVGAVVPQDQSNIVQLIKKVIMCLAYASSDENHSGVRYARLLNGLLRVFSRGVDGGNEPVKYAQTKSGDSPGSFSHAHL